MVILGQSKNPSTGQVHTGPSSVNFSTLKKLQYDIKAAMLYPRSPRERFVPDNVLKNLINNEEDVKNVLEEVMSSSSLSHRELEISLPKLATFIVKDAYRVFASLVWKEKPHLIEQFCVPDFQQEMLPVKEEADEGNFESCIGGGNREILNEIFSGTASSLWLEGTRDDFCSLWQWPFFAPIFVKEKFRYKFPADIHLPFISTGRLGTAEKPNDDTSHYSWMREKTIHAAHLKTDLVRRFIPWCTLQRIH
jgi:hypothetical protein